MANNNDDRTAVDYDEPGERDGNAVKAIVDDTTYLKFVVASTKSSTTRLRNMRHDSDASTATSRVRISTYDTGHVRLCAQRRAIRRASRAWARAARDERISKTRARRRRLDGRQQGARFVDARRNATTPLQQRFVDCDNGPFTRAKTCDRKTHAHRFGRAWLEHRTLLGDTSKLRCTGAKPGRRHSVRQTQQTNSNSCGPEGLAMRNDTRSDATLCARALDRHVVYSLVAHDAHTARALDQHVVDATMCALGGNGVELDWPLQPFTIGGDDDKRELCAVDDAAHELAHVDFATQYTIVAAIDTLTRLLALDDDDAVLDSSALVVDDINKSATRCTRIEVYALDVVTVDEPLRSSTTTATSLVARHGQFKKAKSCDRKTHAHRFEHDWLEHECYSVNSSNNAVPEPNRLDATAVVRHNNNNKRSSSNKGSGTVVTKIIIFDSIENNERTRRLYSRAMF